MSSLQTINIVASDYPVKSVVVLKSSKAEVVRTIQVALQAGQNKVIVSRLPSTIDTQSVRISGLDPNGAHNRTYLSDVVCSISASPDDTFSTVIHELETQKTTLENEKKVLDTQAQVLVKYANSLTGEHVATGVMTDFLNAFGEFGRSNIHAINKLEAEIEKIDKQIKEETKKASLVKGSANTELTAVITADNDTQVQLKLSYIVTNTAWSPTYELHAVTGDDGQPSRTVSLHYCACITQSTGEDWTDAALTLSTVTSDAAVKRIPKLEPLKIRVSYNPPPSTQNFFANQQQQRQVQVMQQIQQRQQIQQIQQMRQKTAKRNAYAPQQQAELFGNIGAQPTGSLSQTAFPPPPPPPPAAAPVPSSTYYVPSAQPTVVPIIGMPESSPALSEELEEEEEEEEEDNSAGISDAPARVVTQTPMALTYSVRGKSSIPSDGKEHKVTIAVLSFNTDVEYVSVPRVDPRVYLQCQVENNSEYRLLPGPVSVILDDSYVSKTTISDVNRNDVFQFTLGDDPSVLVSYSRLSKNVKEGSGSFADVVNVTTYATTITVRNKHTFSIEKLVLKDAVPISNDNRARVVLREPRELVEAKEGVLVTIRSQGTRVSSGPPIVAEGDNGGDDDDDDEEPKARWTKEKEGLYEYRWRVDPDAKIKLATVFEMKASADLSCSFMENFGNAMNVGQKSL